MRLTILLCLLAVPAFAQTPPQSQPRPAPAAPAPGAPPAQAAPNPAAVPLPQWFVEIDTAKKGEVSRADFVKYRIKNSSRLPSHPSPAKSRAGRLSRTAATPHGTNFRNSTPIVTASSSAARSRQ